MSLGVTNLAGFGAGDNTPLGLQLTFVASAGGTTSCTCPTVEPGDLLLYFCSNGTGDTSAGSPPSGFTHLVAPFHPDTSTRWYFFSYKIAVGNEDGTSLAGTYTTRERCGVLVFRPNQAINTVTLVDLDAEVNTGNMSPHNIPADTRTAPVIAIAWFVASDAITLETFTPSPDGAQTWGGTTGEIQWLLFNSSPQAVTADMGDHGTFNIMCVANIVVT